MRLAIEAAGFSAGEADQLRRAMGHKRSRERMHEIHRAARGRHGRQRHRSRRRRAALSHARRLCRLRLSGVARGEFRAAGLRVGVREVPLSRRSLPRRFSTCSRWAFTLPKCWSTTRGGTALRSKPIEVNASEYWSHVEPERRVAVGISSRARTGRRAAEAPGSGARGGAVRRHARLSRSARSSRSETLENLGDRRRFRAVVRVAPRSDVGAARRSTSAKRAGNSASSWTSTSPPLRSRRRSRRSRDSRLRSLVDRRHAARPSDASTSANGSTAAASIPAARLAQRAAATRSAGRRPRDHAPASRHGQGLRLPDARGRNGTRQRDRASRLYERYRRTIRSSSMLIIEGSSKRNPAASTSSPSTSGPSTAGHRRRH